jgi:acetyltransferase-like isoleucine patch superfamily enzyme
MVYRILNKVVRLIYQALHPSLWNKHIGVYGIPAIRGYSRISFGKYVTINPRVYIQGSGGVKIGNYVTLSREVKILTVGIDTKGYAKKCMSPTRLHIPQPVVIGDGVWLAANVMVMPGVTISPGIIVAAGAVVTHNLDKEGWLYAGIPAKAIRQLK